MNSIVFNSIAFNFKFLILVFLIGFSSCFDQTLHGKSPRTLHPYLVVPSLSSHGTLVSGEHISVSFFMASEESARARDNLQELLHNFLENLQRNLTTSTVLNTVVNTIDMRKTQRQMRKLADLSAFFELASESAAKLAAEVNAFFEVTKNESNALLLKLRRVPTGHRLLPMQVKMHLTNYFTEMEFFHVSFSEVIDDALEYIVDTLHVTQRTFIRYADIQRDVLHNWNFKPDEYCCNRYMDFLQQWSAEIFKCSAGIELHTAYDIYAMTEVTAKYILRQQEFRIQRLFNCFLFGGNYEVRCRFLLNAERDFEKLFSKLDELQMYFDIKTKHGRITTYRQPRRRRQDYNQELAIKTPVEDTFNIIDTQDKCVPYGFPDTQMQTSLKACFYFPDFN